MDAIRSDIGEFLKATMDSLADHMAVLDDASAIVYVNNAWKRFGDENGLAVPDYGIGMKYLDVCDSARGKWRREAPLVARGIREVLSGNQEEFSLEYACHYKEIHRWFRLKASRFHLDGRAWAVLVHEDVTRQTLMGRELNRSENRLTGIIGSVPDAMCLLDRAGTVIWANDPAMEIFGPHMENKRCAEAYGNKDRVCPTCIVRDTFDDGRVHSREYTHVDVQGRERIFVCRTSVAGYDDDGRPAQVMEILHDVTEHRIAEKEVRRLSQAVEYSPVSVVITDVSGNIEYVNPKFTEVTGYTLEEAMGRNPRILNSGHQPGSYYETLWQTILSGREWKGEFVNRKKNGELYWESASISPILNDAGEITYFVAVKEEITERKKMISQLKTAKDKAESATRAKSDFLATMSHEIRTPMNAILGMSHLVLETDLDERQHRYVSNIYTAADALLSIINDILDLSKIEAGKWQMEHTEFEFGTLMEKILNVMKFEAREKGLDLIYTALHPLPLTLQGDPTRISQVIMNLLSNAVKYTETGRVCVTSEKKGETQEAVTLELTVEDTGIGMTREQMDGLFRPFTQADSSTTRKYGGTGLGLVIVKRLVEMMGGCIDVQSRPGRGTCFFVTLVPGFLSTGSEASFPIKGRVAGLKVLVLEPDQVRGIALKRNLEALGALAALAATPDQAASLLAGTGGPWDLMVVDESIAPGDHESLVEVLWNRERSGNLKFLIICNSPSLDSGLTLSKTKGFLRSLDIEPAFIEQPIPPITLVRTLNDLMTETRFSLAQYSKNQPAAMAGKGDDMALKQILVVDDDDVNREIVTSFLKKAGVSVTQTGDGESALDMVAGQFFHLVFMDIEMPVLDGYEATRRIRRLDVPWAGTLPIVALTGHVLSEFRKKCYEAGMDDYLDKPVKPDKLYGMLEKWVGYRMPGPDAEPAGVPDSDSAGGFVSADHHIHTRTGLEYVNDSMSLYAKMLEKFSDTYGNTDKQLRENFNAGDVEACRHLMHKLKSIAGMIGARHLAAITAELERMFTREPGQSPESPSAAQAEERMAAFSAELAHTQTAILQILKTLDIRDGTGENEPIQLETGNDGNALEQLMQLLQEGIEKQQPLECRNLIKQILSGPGRESLARPMGEIERLIAKYRFKQAAQKLARIMEEGRIPWNDGETQDPGGR